MPGHRVRVSDETEARRIHAHLLHFRVGRQAGLETGHLVATTELPGFDRILNGVGIIPVHVRMVVGDLERVSCLEFTVLQMLRQTENGSVIEFHQ